MSYPLCSPHRRPLGLRRHDGCPGGLLALAAQGGGLPEKRVSMMNKEDFMRRAIELGVESVRQGGGPFGAVVVKDGEVIAEGNNRVTLDNDPTAHAEVCAIRHAARRLGSFNLSGCEIYTSCEPCPMCLGAIYWARLDRVYYGCDRKDAADAGFDDDFIYRELALAPEKRSMMMAALLPQESLATFRMWREKGDRKEY